MDFDLREWLLILGPVFVAVILLHGYWRMRRGNNELRMALDKSFMTGDEVDDLAMLKAELPNGGARVIGGEDFDLDQEVPMLMEPVSVTPERREEEAPQAEIPVSVEPVRKAPPAVAPVTTEKPEKFIVLNVLATGEAFDGQALLEALMAHDFTFGEMDIFHVLGNNGESEFSLVNAVEPGTFDPATMHEMSTPGVTLFMRAHEMADPIGVFDRMVEKASLVSDELGGQLCDDTRSAVTEQTVENLRQGLREFQFRYSA